MLFIFEFCIHANFIKRSDVPTDKWGLLDILVNKNEIKTGDHAPNFLKNIDNLSCNVFIGFAMVLCLIKCTKLQSVLSSVNFIDRKLIQLGMKFDYKKTSRCTMLLVLPICFAFLIIPSTYDGIILKNCAPIACILFHLPHLIRSFMKFKFIVIMWHIRKRFQYVEKILKTIPNDDCIPAYSATNRKQHYPIIAELCQLHKELCDTFYCAQKYFNHQILIMVAIDFFYLMHNSYYIIDVIYNDNKAFETQTNSNVLIRSSIYFWLLAFGSIYFIIKTADDIRNEVS